MPTKIDYYLVSFVNLSTGEFFNEEMTDIDISMLGLKTKVSGDSIQILNKQYFKTEKIC
ncbi:hypothetical protein [Rossellomorea marisflavi]|uniref:hypothetical protein n=1 Tax=Rossellomorea marisflavi TaxID=189381 RepID=UPI00345DAB1F